MDDQDNTSRTKRTQAEKEEEIKKYSLILESLQSNVSALQKENDRLKKLDKDLAEKNAKYEDFSLDNVRMAYDALMTESMEFQNEFNRDKDVVVNDFEAAIHDMDKLCILCEAETQKDNVLKDGTREIIEKSRAYRTEIDVCEIQITDLMVKKNKLDIQESELEKEAADLRDHTSHKQKELSELKAQVASSEEKAVIMEKEFQDKLKNLKGMNQSLKARDKEMAKNLMQARAMSKNLSKSLKKKQENSEILQKGINAIQKELKKDKGFKSTKDLLKCYKKGTKAINAEIDNLTTKLHKSDEEKHRLEIKKVQDALARIAAEREMLSKKRNKVPSKLLEVSDVHYKAMENIYKKLMALHGNPVVSHSDQPEYQDNFKDEAIVEDMKIMKSSRKKDFKKEEAVVNNNKRFQKKAKCNGRNHPLPGNKRIAPESVNENAENGSLNTDIKDNNELYPLQVDKNSADILRKDGSPTRVQRKDGAANSF